MKRLTMMLTVIIFGSLLASAQNSVADAARKARAEKKAAPPAKHVYTDDDFASKATPAVEKEPVEGAEGAAAGEGSEKEADKKDAQNGTDKKEVSAKTDAMKEQIAQQKKAIEEQEKELSIMEREHQIRVAEYYADAGTQLRTGEKWFEQEKKYQEDLAAKKKALADAKAKLDELSEQARKAGLPSS